MKWKTLSSKELYKTAFMKLRMDECEMPSGKIMPHYYVVEFSDWVHVIPITHEGKIVLVEQYRHAMGDIYLELPGGTTNPRQKEDPKLAAVRELEEETGYECESIELIGTHAPNPALQNNQMHTYIAYGCKKVKEQNLDPYEDIQVIEMSKEELLEKISAGQIQHSLVLASILMGLKKL